MTDESGGVLPGVAVTIRNQGTGVSARRPATRRALYRAPLLPVGTYEVTAALAGFATTRRPGLTLSHRPGPHRGPRASGVPARQEEVTVTAEAPVIEVARTHQASTVGERAVANLPVNGRNFIDFVLTTPGVTRDVRGGDISFAGQRGTLNSLVIDGADNNNTFFGQTLGRTGSGRAPVPVQPGRGAGVPGQPQRLLRGVRPRRGRRHQRGDQVRAPTSSTARRSSSTGTRSSNANSYANKIAHPRPASARRTTSTSSAARWAAPSSKDKAFFFVSYDGQRNTIPNEISLATNLPGLTSPRTRTPWPAWQKLQTKAGNWERAQDQDVFLAKVDYQIDTRHRLSVRYNHQNFTGRELREQRQHHRRSSTAGTAW